jgi:hypothetical protein
MFHVVPGRSSNWLALAQNRLIAFPPMRRLAVPPVTVPKASISSGNAAGQAEGVITVVVSVPVVVFPVFHVTTKVPVPAVCVARPPEIDLRLHPFAMATLPAAVLPVKLVQLTIVGLAAVVGPAANAEPVGTARRSPAAPANDAVSVTRIRRICLPSLRPRYLRGPSKWCWRLEQGTAQGSGAGLRGEIQPRPYKPPPRVRAEHGPAAQNS